MRSKAFIIGILGLMIFVQGCSTLKEAARGATKGFKDDWKVIREADDWLEEKLW